MSTVVAFYPCTDCDGRDIRTDIVDDEFPYGVLENPVMIKATIPVRHCNSCGAEWTDYEAEGIREKAVKEHLARSSG